MEEIAVIILFLSIFVNIMFTYDLLLETVPPILKYTEERYNEKLQSMQKIGLVIIGLDFISLFIVMVFANSL